MRANYTILGGGGDDLSLVVRLKNLASLVQREGGTTGSFAMSLLPETISTKAYDTLKDKLIDGFKQQGVDADVQVISNRPAGAPPPPDFLHGMVVGAGAVGVGYLLWLGVRRLIAR